MHLATLHSILELNSTGHCHLQIFASYCSLHVVLCAAHCVRRPPCGPCGLAAELRCSYTLQGDMYVKHLRAVQQTGAAVVNGALSTLIAALCLSGSGSYVFLTFFYALLFIVLCGAFSGLVVLPVLLDTFQPAPHSEVVSQMDGGPQPGEVAGNPDDSKVPQPLG